MVEIIGGSVGTIWIGKTTVLCSCRLAGSLRLWWPGVLTADVTDPGSRCLQFFRTLLWLCRHLRLRSGRWAGRYVLDGSCGPRRQVGRRRVGRGCVRRLVLQGVGRRRSNVRRRDERRDRIATLIGRVRVGTVELVGQIRIAGATVVRLRLIHFAVVAVVVVGARPPLRLASARERRRTLHQRVAAELVGDRRAGTRRSRRRLPSRTSCGAM